MTNVTDFLTGDDVGISSVKLSREHINFIPKIYETAVNPDGWSSVLDEFAHHCGAAASSLIFGNNTYPGISNRVLSKLMTSLDVADYNMRFGKEEAEALAVISSYPVHTWVSDEDAFGKSADEIPCTLFGRDNYGLDRRVTVRLIETPNEFHGISLKYKLGRGNMTEDEMAVSQLFLPHISKALEITRPFAHLQRQFQDILNVLDMLKIGVIVTTHDGEVVIKNCEADNVLDADNGFTLSHDKKLICRLPEQSEILSTLITTAADTRDIVDFDSILAVPKRTTGLPWLLKVVPLSNLHSDMDKMFQGAAIFITDPDRKDVVSTNGMDALFHLTPAESDVCAMLAQGMKIEDIAETRNVSTETVRSQVKDLFSKTNSNSQIDLVRLALKVNSPVNHPDKHKKDQS